LALAQFGFGFPPFLIDADIAHTKATAEHDAASKRSSFSKNDHASRDVF
jgi:hypothetical protein